MRFSMSVDGCVTRNSYDSWYPGLSCDGCDGFVPLVVPYFVGGMRESGPAVIVGVSYHRLIDAGNAKRLGGAEELLPDDR